MKIELERFEKGIGVDINTFISIITKGFYYIGKDKGIYWTPNAVFVGNGYCPHSNNMVRTHYLIKDIEKAGKYQEDCHYWNWKNEEDVFNFENYGKTWSVNKEDLEALIK